MSDYRSFSAYDDDRGLPGAPRPLDEEETGGDFPPTERVSEDDDTLPPGSLGVPAGYHKENEETQLPRRPGRQGYFDEDETQLPSRKTRILDSDEDEIEETVLEREEITKMGWLIVKRSPVMRRGHILRIRPGVIIGRHPVKADILIDDEKISGLHARIQIKDDQFILFDLGSANGTWLDGEEIKGSSIIVQDQEIRIGDTTFVLKTL